MLIPIRTDNRLSRRPVVNYAIIAANAAVFLLGYRGNNPAIQPFLLNPAAPRLVQFFTSMFLHYGWAHILGNMLFLWVFGNAVNDRLGHVGYAAFYLAGGVLSGLGYVLLSGTAPVLGASGAISAVTGAYLVLFPRVRVTLLAWLFVVLLPFEVSSLLFLGFQFAFNLWAGLSSAGGGVAYMAHASGYVYGIALSFGLLGVGLLPRDVYDLLSLWKTHRRRSSYRRMVSQGYSPFLGSQPGQNNSGRYVQARAVDSQARTDTPSGASMELRQKISAAHGMGDFSGAANYYIQLLGLDDNVVLARQPQLDVANQLMTEQRYAQAADAYERLMRHYPNYEHRADIQLMLGIIYGRYLGQKDRAVTNLRLALEGLHDERKLTLARAELEAASRST